MNNAAFLRLLVAERGRHQQAIAAIDALLAVYDSHPSEEALQATEREQLQPLLQDTPDPSAGAPAAAISPDAPAEEPSTAGPLVQFKARPLPKSWVTDARNEVCRQLYPDHATRAVYEAVCRLPGPPPSSLATVQTHCIQKLKLKKIQMPLRQLSKADVMQRIGQIKAQSPAEPIFTDLGTIIAKAGTWGLSVSSWADLDLVNEHAKRIGHRPFARDPRTFLPGAHA